jgi:hypothetical protein
MFRRNFVELDGTEESLWRAAMRHAPLSYRWFGRSLTIMELDLQMRDAPQWLAAKKSIQAGDRIWPFVFNSNTLAMRKGYVIVRKGKPITGIVTVVS